MAVSTLLWTTRAWVIPLCTLTKLYGVTMLNTHLRVYRERWLVPSILLVTAETGKLLCIFIYLFCCILSPNVEKEIGTVVAPVGIIRNPACFLDFFFIFCRGSCIFLGCRMCSYNYVPFSPFLCSYNFQIVKNWLKFGRKMYCTILCVLDDVHLYDML